MNADNENIEPLTDLGLAPSNSSRCIQRQLNGDSGAGANASSRRGMTFVASDPLSELVWSPQKGLSLKCADPSFANKNNSLLWGAGESNVAFLMPQSTKVGMYATDKPIDEEVISSMPASHAEDDTAGTNSLTGFPASDTGRARGCGPNPEHNTGPVGNVEEPKTAVGLSVLHVTHEDQQKSGVDYICGHVTVQMAEISRTREKNLSSFPGSCTFCNSHRTFLSLTCFSPNAQALESALPSILGLVNGRIANISAIKLDEPKPHMVAHKPFSEDCIGGSKDFGSGEQILGRTDVLASDVGLVDKCRASESPFQNLRSPGRRHLEELEQTAENDLQTLIGDNTCDAASKIVKSEFAHKGKNNSQEGEDGLPRNNTLPNKLSPTDSRVHNHQRKGKEKASSDGDFGGKLSKEEDDSHESVESCNSAGSFSNSRKRWRFEEHLIGVNKRAKIQIQETPGSTSYIRQDSSFMNWISNMMKGFSKPMQDEGPSPILAISHPDHGYKDNPDQKLLICNKNRDQGLKIGFRSIFHSLYCPKAAGEATSNANYQTGDACKELALPNKIYNINATPVSICEDGDNVRKQFLVSHEKFHESASGNEADFATQPNTIPPKYATCEENSKTNSSKNNNSCEKESGKGKCGINSSLSLGNCKAYNAENTDCDPSSEGKMNKNDDHGKGPLENLWITRFYTKTSGPLLNIGDQDQSIDIECKTECTRLLPCPKNHAGLSNNHKVMAVRHQANEEPVCALGKEPQKYSADVEAVIGLSRTKGHNDLKSVYNLSPLSPSPKFRSSEVMASIFARRLDAFKHILPIEGTDNATRVTTTCLFCGNKGHHLHECSETTESEIEDLLRNLNSYDEMKESPCLCIRCFQLNHWAVACPTIPSRGKHQTKCGDRLAGTSKMQHEMWGNENSKLVTDLKRRFQSACDESDLRRSDHGCSWNVRGVIAPEKTRPNTNSVEKYNAPSSRENYSKEHEIMPVNREIVDVQNRIFDEIKSLRLSRSEILKWMNSHMSLSHLDGFFLRLRLGKWEEGLGGTGYHVACITGKQRGKLPQNAKFSLYVNIGGIKCLVESQYISNHDFLEDELMAWWSAISKDRSNIPSEEDLRAKVKKKRMLGL